MRRSGVLFALLLSGVLLADATVLRAASQTDAKIRLMAEALSARDRGDLATAKAKFESLLEVAPSDTSVQRLLLDVNSRIAEQSEARAHPPVVTEPTTRVAPANRNEPPEPVPSGGMPPVIEEGPPASVAPAQVPAARPDPYAEARQRVEAAGVALAHAEAARLERTAAYVNAQRELARLYARDRNFAAAVAALDAALDGLDTPLKELRVERDAYARHEREAKNHPPTQNPFSRP
jgi:general secretion pathway protein D